MANEDVPSLTLRVLERIQAELVGMRGEIVAMRGDISGMRGELHELRDEVHILNDRFDHFLTFVGRDVQDLKMRVSALEADRR